MFPVKEKHCSVAGDFELLMPSVGEPAHGAWRLLRGFVRISGEDLLLAKGGGSSLRGGDLLLVGKIFY